MTTNAVSAKLQILQVLFPKHSQNTQSFNAFAIGSDKVSLIVFGGALSKIPVQEDPLFKPFAALFSATVEQCSNRLFKHIQPIITAFFVTKDTSPSPRTSSGSVEDKILQLIKQSKGFEIDSYSVKPITQEVLDGRRCFSEKRVHPTLQSAFNILFNDKGDFCVARIIFPLSKKQHTKRRLWIHLFKKTTEALECFVKDHAEKAKIFELEKICEEYGNFFFQALDHSDYKVSERRAAWVFETEVEFMATRNSQEVKEGWDEELRKKLSWFIKGHIKIYTNLIEKSFDVASKDCQFLNDAARSLRDHLPKDLMDRISGFNKIDDDSCFLSLELDHKGVIDPMVQIVTTKKRTKSGGESSTSKKYQKKIS